MEWTNTKAIYLQICDYVYDQIASDNWNEGEKIVSVREMALLISVNHNTVQRSYGHLQNLKIISSERGTGLFVSPGAKNIVESIRRSEFRDATAPEFFRIANNLNIDSGELSQMYRSWQEDNREKSGN